MVFSEKFSLFMSLWLYVRSIYQSSGRIEAMLVYFIRNFRLSDLRLNTLLADINCIFLGTI